MQVDSCLIWQMHCLLWSFSGRCCDVRGVHLHIIIIPMFSNSSITLTISMPAKTVERSSSSCTLPCILTQHFRWYLVSFAVAFSLFGILFRRRKKSGEYSFFANSSIFYPVSLTNPILRFSPGTLQIMDFVLSYNIYFDLNDLCSLFGTFSFF